MTDDFPPKEEIIAAVANPHLYAMISYTKLHSPHSTPKCHHLVIEEKIVSPKLQYWPTQVTRLAFKYVQCALPDSAELVALEQFLSFSIYLPSGIYPHSMIALTFGACLHSLYLSFSSRDSYVVHKFV